MTVPVIEPDSVRGMEVVADVEIRNAVAVQVTKGRRQTPIVWRLPERATTFVQKRPVRPRLRREMPVAVVVIEHVRLALLQDSPFRGDFQVASILGPDHTLSAHIQEGEPGGAHRCCPVICHIQIQRAVAIHIPQRARHRSVFVPQARVLGFGEMSMTIVQKQPRARPDAVNQQVQRPVAVHVGKRRTGREITRQIEAGRRGDISKSPAAQVPIKRQMPFERANENIAPTVPIDIPECNARPIQADLILRGVLVTESICEVQAGLRRFQQGETSLPALWNLERHAVIGSVRRV